MRQSPRNDNAQVTLALAADYFEVLATARSARLLPARRCLVALVREVEPDWATQKGLSRDALPRTPGAREILGL
jgi:hypothetical protein